MVFDVSGFRVRGFGTGAPQWGAVVPGGVDEPGNSPVGSCLELPFGCRGSMSSGARISSPTAALALQVFSGDSR